MNSLSLACRDGAKDKYSGIVEIIIGAARQIRDEVSAMEVDLQIGDNLSKSLEKTRVLMESSVKEVQLVTVMASSKFFLIIVQIFLWFIVKIGVTTLHFLIISACINTGNSLCRCFST